MEYKLTTKPPSLLGLILLVGFPSCVAVLIAPALPAISDAFHVGNGYVQQLIIIFMVGYACGQLIYSPIANRFGRKAALYFGLTLYFVGTLCCLLAIAWHSMNILIVGRLLMALGSSVGMIICFTIINDFYYPLQARRVVSYAVLSYAVMPALGVAMGGQITSHLSWQDCFYFYLIYGVFMLFVVSRFPETLSPEHKKSLQIASLLRDYRLAFADRRLRIFSITFGFMASFVYIIATGGPFIGIDTLGLSAANFGLIMLFPYLAQVLGILLSVRLSRFRSSYYVMVLGYILIAVGVLMMLLCFFMGWVSLVTFIVSIFIIMLGLPIVYSNASVMALAVYEDKATGSAIMTFITMTMALLFTFVLTLLPNKNPLVMPSLLVCILVIALFVFWRARRGYPS